VEVAVAVEVAAVVVGIVVMMTQPGSAVAGIVQ